MALIVICVLVAVSALVAMLLRALLRHFSQRTRLFTQRRVRDALSAVAGVVTLVVGYLSLVGDLTSLSAPIPSFASLQNSPDPTLRGTVAFNALPIASGGKKIGCVDVVPASGGPVRQLFCAEQPKAMSASLRWLPDGRLEATNRGADHWRKIVDVTTGKVVDVAWVKPPTTPSSFPIGPTGQRVAVATSRGVMHLTMRDGSLHRDLLSVRVPPNYSIFGVAWSPDGHWFVAEDGASRLLVITTGESPTTRLLLSNGTDAAVSNLSF